jgi:poly-gamma-glutamate synthesis protein (capsule biosynthesis protein)
MKLVLVGDVMLGRLVNEALHNLPPEYPWGDVMPLLEMADARFCNLECVMADSGTPWTTTPKSFHFRSDAANVAVLQAARVGCVSLANNHVLDYGCDALLEMIAHLDHADIRHAGAGSNLEAAASSTVVACADVQLGFLAFTDNEPGWKATHSTPGIFYVPAVLENPQSQALLSLVSQKKQQVDRLIVSAHWGPNWGHRPSDERVRLAHALVDHGADIVFGHSCHVVQGIELYRGQPILYGCGDFIDDYAVDLEERNDESFVFVIDFNVSEMRRLLLYPTYIHRFQARLAQRPQADAIASRMQHLSDGFGTQAIWDADKLRLEIDISAA